MRNISENGVIFQKKFSNDAKSIAISTKIVYNIRVYVL